MLKSIEDDKELFVDTGYISAQNIGLYFEKKRLVSLLLLVTVGKRLVVFFNFLNKFLFSVLNLIVLIILLLRKEISSKLKS
jgi:hypothetical protein